MRTKFQEARGCHLERSNLGKFGELLRVICVPATTRANRLAGPSVGAFATSRTKSPMSFLVGRSLCTMLGDRRTPIVKDK